MLRINRKLLTARALQACEAVGLDFGPGYVGGKAIVGRVGLAKGFTGWDLEQIVNEGGGIRQLNGACNSLKASEMLAFIDGMIFAARALKQEG